MVFNILKIILFEIKDGIEVNDDICMCYCYLDFCCLEMFENFKLCVKVIYLICNYFDNLEFIDVEILMLIKLILEGV